MNVVSTEAQKARRETAGLFQRCFDGITKELLHPVNVLLRAGACEVTENDDLLGLRNALMGAQLDDPMEGFDRWPQKEWLSRLGQLRDAKQIITHDSFRSIFEVTFGEPL